MIMRWTALILPVCLLALVACAAGPNYKAPAVPLPQHWHAPWAAGVPVTPLAAGEPWWKSLHDATLDRLMQRALDKNQDLKIAEGRILEARATRHSAAAEQYPQVQGNSQATRGDEGFQSFDKNLTLYDAHFDASYELDVFGGVRRRVEAESAAVQASSANLRDVTLTLTAEVARDYITWRQLQQQLELTRSTISAQHQLYDIVVAQRAAGVASDLDVSQAGTLLKTSQARLPGIEQQLAATGYALSVLLGENPGPLNDELKHGDQIALPGNVSVLASPAEVIARRPDVERAERELAEATALHGAAISDMYPKVSLSALFGVQDTSLGGGGSIWSLGSGVVMPLLNFGRIEGQIKAADARQQQAFHTYRQTVLKALADVETSLTDLAKENRQRLALQAAAESAGQTLTMSQSRYDKGITDLTAVLEAKQQLYAAESDAAAARAAALIDVVALYKAVGAESIPPATRS
jgi:NodT family efflux transporter outer membrane factor (OMF) lipoprotein